MPEPYADTLATVAAGRTALVDRLRTIAAPVEALPLESAADELGVLEAAVPCASSAQRWWWRGRRPATARGNGSARTARATARRTPGIRGDSAPRSPRHEPWPRLSPKWAIDSEIQPVVISASTTRAAASSHEGDTADGSE